MGVRHHADGGDERRKEPCEDAARDESARGRASQRDAAHAGRPTHTLKAKAAVPVLMEFVTDR